MISHLRARADNVIEKEGGNVVTYFCTPHGHVLHFVVGPVPSESLLASARWSYDIHQQLLQQQEAGKTFEERRSWVKVQHEKRLAKANADRLIAEKESERLREEIRKHRSQQHHDDSRAANKQQTLFSLYEAYNASRIVVGKNGHWLLGKQPLPHLSEIETQVFERLAGQVFSRRSHQMRERILENCEDERPTLLVVADTISLQKTSKLNPAGVSPNREPKLDDYFPKDVCVRRYLKAFHTEVLTQGELTALTAAPNRPPIPTRSGVSPTYVILDGQGKISDVLTTRDSLDVLALLMEKYSGERDKHPDQTISEPSVFFQEELARCDLRLAKHLLPKLPGNARERLKKVVAQYPGTESAFDALWLLARRGK